MLIAIALASNKIVEATPIIITNLAKEAKNLLPLYLCELFQTPTHEIK